MNFSKTRGAQLAAASIALLGGAALHSQVHAATATFDPATLTVDIPVVDLVGGAEPATISAQLQLVTAEPPFRLELIGAGGQAPQAGQRNTFDSSTLALHLSALDVGGVEYYTKMKYIPGSDPIAFEVEQLVNNQFSTCPDFAQPGPVAASCVLQGEISQDITLTKDATWLISGGVFIGGDNANSATLTINPGTNIVGQEGADFLWIRRGSKIMAEGTPDNSIVFTGPREQAPGEWGGVVIAGNAPVNGCADDVAVCEVAFEAITTESYGGNNPEDNSGVMKYTQIRFAGFEVRQNEELNGLTLLGVGSGTLIDFAQVHAGLDDGVEMFGGTVQMKHLVLTEIGDDSLDWGQGWRGKAQFVLVKQADNDGDRAIEADNNEDNNDAAPRAKPVISNITAIGSPVGTEGALLRRGTGVNIWNSVFTGFGGSCLEIDGAATYANAGSIGSLTGELTIVNSYVNCATNFTEGEGATFTVSDWFNNQSGNVEGDPQLIDFLPDDGSPLTTAGTPVSGDDFFDSVDYSGAFKDAQDDWTEEWADF